MPSTYTANNGIEKIGTGEQSGTWGDTTNVNFDIIDRAINGVGALSLTGTSTTLTTSDGATSDGHYKILVLGGSPTGTNTITLSPNDQDKLYLVKNDSGETVIFTQGSGGNATIADGDIAWIFADGAGSGAAVTKTDFVTTSGTQTLTNKTLSAPTITGDATAVTQTAGDSSTKLATTAYADTAAGGGIPTGAVFHFAMTSAPSGYLVCDGSAVSRTTYADLYTAIGDTFGSGDGSTTFNLPDLVGQFIRGYNSTASGKDASRVFGSEQEDSITNHNHEMSCTSAQTPTFADLGASEFHGGHSVTNRMGYGDTGSGKFLGSSDVSTRGNLGVDKVSAFTSGANTTSETETRPTNVALLACIRT